MTCRYSSEARPVGQPADHLAHCPECRSRLEEARLLLLANAPMLQPEARARVWSAIRRDLTTTQTVAPRRQSPSVPAFAVALVGVAALLALAGPLTTTPVSSPPKVGVHSPLPIERVLRIGKATITAQPTAEIQVSSSDPSRALVSLGSGRVDVLVDKLVGGETFELATPNAKIEVVGTRFTVEVGTIDCTEGSCPSIRTSVHVVAGVVSVTRSPTDVIILGPGEHLVVDSRRLTDLAVDGRSPPRSTEAQTARTSSQKWSGATQAKISTRPPPPSKPAPPTEPDSGLSAAELLETADRLRQAGLLRDALERYDSVANLATGRPYAEEVEYRRAELLFSLSRLEEAERACQSAADSFPSGSLHPERTALWARIVLSRNDPVRAARILTRAPPNTQELEGLRVSVAERLLVIEPSAARALVRGLSGDHLRDRVRRILDQTEPPK